MKDDNKTKKQLIDERAELRSQNAELNQSTTDGSDLKYRQFAEDMPALICSFLPDSTLTYVNSAYCKLFSKQHEDLVGQKFLDFLPDKAARENVRNQYMSLTPENPVKTYEHEVIVADGTNQHRWHRWTDRAFFSDKGEILHFQSIGQDITERKQMEDNLREGEERFRLITETIDEVFWMADAEIGRMFYISPGFEHVWKRSMNSLYENPRSFIDAVHVEDRERVQTALTIEKTGQPFDHEYRIVLPNGNIRHIWDRGFPIRNENGQVTRYAGVASDITERKQAEEELKESRERYSAIFDQSPIAIEFYDSDGCLINVNSACRNLFGVVNINEISGFKLFEDPNISKDIKTKLLNRENVRFEAEFNFEEVKRLNLYQTTCSGIKMLDWSISPLTNGNVVIGYILQIQDITERKQSEEALRESESRYRLLAEHTQDIVWMADMDTRTSYQSPSSEILRGFTVQELRDLPLEKNLTPDSLKLAMELMFSEIPKIKADPGYNPVHILELEYYRKDGTTVWLENKLSVIRDESGKPVSIMGEGRDIAERKQAEEALRESEERFRRLADAAWEGIIIHKEGTIIEANESALKTTGYSIEEIIGKNIITFVAPESIEPVIHKLSEGTTHDRLFLELKLIRKDKSIFSAEALGRPIRYKNIDARVLAFRDITERKQAEEKLQTTLESLRKSFAATVQVMVSAVESRDPYTSGHQIRSADLARAIATEMELPQEKIEGIRMAGSIHDIGKLSIPAEILSKPTKLSDLEFSMIKEHARKGYEMLKDVESPWSLAEIVYQHHERMDGSGYPRNLKGDEILIEARILNVADTVEAMASHRPYRAGLGINAALNEIEKNRGIFYDEAVVAACLRLFRKKGFQLEGIPL